ncbi:hypothetical protein PG985_003807 [Apiospora marii]|uniref:C2H2-type domain-containing protein n=1 Tax=Apiospora marii TaxID=335849 RepID=A0ABR1SJC9_9PEZI
MADLDNIRSPILGKSQLCQDLFKQILETVSERTAVQGDRSVELILDCLRRFQFWDGSVGVKVEPRLDTRLQNEPDLYAEILRSLQSIETNLRKIVDAECQSPSLIPNLLQYFYTTRSRDPSLSPASEAALREISTGVETLNTLAVTIQRAPFPSDADSLLQQPTDSETADDQSYLTKLATSQHIKSLCPSIRQPLADQLATSIIDRRQRLLDMQTQPDGEHGEWKPSRLECLKPYVCISEQCKYPSPHFRTAQEWRNHMENTHSPQWPQTIHAIADWHCTLCTCDVNFEYRHELEEHIRTCHGLHDTEQIALRMEGSFQTQPRHEGICPLCNESVPSKTSTADFSLTHDEGSQPPFQEHGMGECKGASSQSNLDAISTHVAEHLEGLASLSFSSLEIQTRGVESGDSASEILNHLDATAADDPVTDAVAPGLEHQIEGTWLSN